MDDAASPGTPEEYFAGSPRGLALFRAVVAAAESFGEVRCRVTKSQIALRRRKGFAYVWRPDLYLRGGEVPAVLSLPLPYEVRSPRFKEVAHPAPRVWTHHLELREPADVDAEVRGRLREAYDHAG